LAERAGLSPRGLSDLERGARRAPYRDTMLRLADALRLQPADREDLLSAGRRRPRSQALSQARSAALLPITLSTFVGRQTELVDLRARLESTRLVTLTGPGGVGKSRLAIELATQIADTFGDGVCFVPLEAIRDPDLVGPTMAKSLGIRDLGGQSLLQRLEEQLRTRRLLLVLDNFECVVAAAALVGDLLASTQNLKVLVTSREPLRIQGEQELLLAPLSLPDPNRLPRLEALPDYGAIALFIDRAAAINPGFALNSETAAAVAEICARLDGLPLAIELAAARIRYLSPRAIVSRLEHRLALLSDGPRDLPQRHHTLRAAIAWSYELLDEPDRRVFRQCSVFVGGFSLAAAEAVAADADGRGDVLDRVGSLVAKSLVHAADGPDAEPRFGMLETIREFGLEQLEASRELDRTRARHAAFFLGMAERAEPELLGHDQVSWMHKLSADYDNIRAILAWSRDGLIEAEVGLRLVGALGSFWMWWGDIREGRQAADAILRLPSTQAPTPIRARAVLAAARMAVLQDDVIATRAFTHESTAIFREHGDLQGTARALIIQAVAEIAAQDNHAAGELLQEAIPLARQADDGWGLALGLSQMMSVLRTAGDYATAAAVGEEALAAARPIGDRVTFGLSLAGLGWLARLRGDTEAATALFHEALEVSSEFAGSWKMVPRLLAGLAWAAGLSGDWLRSARLFGAAHALFEASGQREFSHLRAMFDSDAARAEATLGPATYAARWAEGRAMATEEALSYALHTREP
jgi:predicted ATPase